MSKPISVGFTYGTVTTSLLLSQLDTNFGTVFGAINDFATYGNYLVDSSGTPNQITVTIPAGTTFSYSAGVPLQVQIANTNTSTAVNINVSLLGNKAVQNIDGSLPSVGQLVAGMILQLQYNGTAFLMTGATSKSIAPFTVTAGGNVTLPAPSSGIALTVNGVASSVPVTINSAGVGSALVVNGVAATNLSIITAQQSGQTAVLIYNPASTGDLRFFLNGADRVLFGSAGNVTINAPSSGVSLIAVAGASADAAQFNVNHASGTGIAFNDTNGSPQSFRIGLGVGDATPSLTFFDSTNVAVRMKIASDGGVLVGAPTGGSQGAGTLNAQEIYRQGSKIVQTGTFTGTLTGCTTAPTATFNYCITGNIAVIYSSSALIGTSNSTTCSITGLPAVLTPVNSIIVTLADVFNNGAHTAGAAAQVSGTTLFLYAGPNAAPFVNTGIKGYAGSNAIIYPLA